MRAIARSLSLLLVACAFSADAPQPWPGTRAPPQAERTQAQAKGLPSPDYLSQLARAHLRRRMARHGQDLQSLISAVVLLDKDVARDFATRIATEPRLARPEFEGDEDTLNKALPLRFFTLQDELRRRAQQVADAAKGDDDAALAEAFGRLAETCVSCHSAFLKPEPR